MVTFLTVVHIVVCIFLVIVVLLQHGKGADMGATFGGGSQTVFGARGATTILSKVTVGAAFIFMVTSISLAYFSSSGASKSLLEGVKSTPKVEVSPVPSVVASPATGVTPTVAPTTSKMPPAKK